MFVFGAVFVFGSVFSVFCIDGFWCGSLRLHWLLLVFVFTWFPKVLSMATLEMLETTPEVTLPIDSRFVPELPDPNILVTFK